MKIFTPTTLIALLMSIPVFSQTQKEPGKYLPGGTTVNQASDSRLILLSPGSKPVLFRWIALVPKPKEPVTYRLKVWQLMQGQNAVEAMRSNQPVVTKEVENITQVAVNNLYTGPCKPPYLCDFIWAVEVFNSDEIVEGKIYAASRQYSFKFNATADVPAGLATANNKGNAGNTGMPTGKSINANRDPVHGVDVKPGIKTWIKN